MIGKWGVIFMNAVQLRNIGSTNINKGSIGKDRTLIAWDAIQNCKDNECMVSDRCSYDKKGKCGVQVDYLTTLTQVIMDRYKFLDEMALFKIGMHIVPLYSQLCRMKILEMSLNDIEIIDNKGRIMIHPVYKEIKNTLVVISMMWRDLDFTISHGSFGEDSISVAPLHGDSAYYDSLSTSEEKREITR